MSFTLFPERLPSTWRLGILLAVLMAATTAFCIVVASLAIRRDLRSIAEVVVLDDLGEYSVLYNKHGLEELDAAFEGGEHGDNQAVRVTEASGAVVREKIPTAMTGYAWPTLPPAKGTRNSTKGMMTVEAPGKEAQLLVGYQRLKDGRVLWFGRTDEDDRAHVRRIRGRLWLAGLASTGLMLLPLWWFVRHVMRPVQEMMQGIRTLAHGSTQSRLVAPGAVPELKAFVTAFNSGLDRIDGLTGELQDANDMLAHELRTPLARIRGNLEIHYDSTEDPRAREAAARGMEEIDRAADLIQMILTTRAGEHRALKLHLEDVDAGDWLGTLHELYRAAADDRGLVFEMGDVPPVCVHIDHQRASQAVANLLDNAFAYTPPGGRITLSAESHDPFLRVVVRDTGPGLTEADPARIWERYTRGSAASAETPGLGLGLALVRAVAHAHGGDVGGENNTSGGARFWVDFPLCTPSRDGRTQEPGTTRTEVRSS